MKVTPKVKGPKNYCDYADLNYGDCFIYHSELWMKMVNVEDEEQMAVNFNGDWQNNMCDEQVLPVDAEIKWAKQKE